MSDDPNFPRRTGRGMLLLASLGVLLLLTLGFDRLIDGKRNPNSDPQSRRGGAFVEVALAANDRHHYVASVRINGHKVEALVDTGASQVAISAALARKLGLPRGPAFKVSTANGIATAYATRVTSIRLGEIELHDVAANIVPNMAAPEVLLGMSFLRELEMTQRNGELVLRQNL